MRIKKVYENLYKSVMIVLFHKVRTSALLITDPTPQPMTSTATIAAAAVPCKEVMKFVIEIVPFYFFS